MPYPTAAASFTLQSTKLVSQSSHTSAVAAIHPSHNLYTAVARQPHRFAMGRKAKREARMAPLVQNTGMSADMRPFSQPTNSSSLLDGKKYVVGKLSRQPFSLAGLGSIDSLPL